MIKEFRLLFNDTELQFGNDRFLNFNLKMNNDWDNISHQIGNKETLTSWTDHLPREFISLYLPWCYSRTRTTLFP